MSALNNGGPAFPDSVAIGPAGDVYGATGMTLRDYFAAKALQGFCANPAVFAANNRSGWALVNSDAAGLAEYCGHLADAMLAERAKVKP